MNVTELLIKRTSELIYSVCFKEASRKRPTDFTRDRKMPFEEVILFMLLSFKCSTQSALRRFFTALCKPVFMKQQSFSEARAKIKVEAFIQLFNLTVEVMRTNCRRTWHGYRLLAVDGSKIALPADKNLLKHFGGTGRHASSPTAQGSIAYDVLNDIVMDALLAPLSTDERTLAKQHLDKCKAMDPREKKLFVFDRGYASFELIDSLVQNGFQFVMRVREKFNLAIDAQTRPDGFVWLEKNGKRIRVRVIKFKLDSGETETLITGLDKRMGTRAFKQLYFLRWPVETKYDLVKNKLQMENFTSRTVEGIGQDFYATLYLANTVAATAFDAQAEIDETRKDKENQYDYQTNRNELIGILKDRFILAVIQEDQGKSAAMIQCIIDEVARSVVPKRLGRSIPRNPSPRKSKFHHNRKVNC
ncbi:IS4 family transposase [Paenibacillus alkaliterrae]|uniref:IS4 family transposase n=1 Tax=Paenibacillus alkaliterrae TaxID=320909 RepID=UPI001F1B946D|nr:IS4 family transposase [Paenibacillus alkaliterrae]MCF2941965.1 IS4 family transposase [Paenibacillus alkaliterrae]